MSPTTSPHLISTTTAAAALLAALLIFTIQPAAATDHIVGANKGWNPGVNYTLWANNQTFYVGDFISFRYQKSMYNVFRVNETGYDNCTTEGAFGNWSSGKDFILFNKSDRYYFICGTGGCFNGMKVSVFVHTLPSPPHSKTANHSATSQAEHRTGFVARVVSGLAMAGVSLLWV